MIQKNILIILAALSLSVPSLAADRNSATQPTQHAYITPCAPGVIYIQFRIGSTVPKSIAPKGGIIQSVGASAFQKVMSKLGLHEIIPFDAHASKDSIDRALGIDRMYCLYYSNRIIDPHVALAMLLTTGEIECGSVRYLFPETSQPNDPDLVYQYALTKMNVFNAWNTTTGDTSIVIADVDCAINIDHEDLKNEIKYNWGEIGTDAQGHDKRSNGKDDDGDGYIDNWEGWDLCGDVPDGAVFQPNNDPRPREDGASHGTHTAGCILATGNNGVGIAGIAYGCRLLPIKASGSDFENISAGYEGIHYASTHGARIINCSWGGSVILSDTTFSNIFLEEAIARKALVVASAANGSVSNDPNIDFTVYPANGPGVLSVGATDQNDLAASYSDFGHAVSVWAPGTGIYSCDYTGVGSNSAYSAEDGTSFSSPLTAGVAGLVMSQHPSWPPQFVARQIIQTVDNVINPTDRLDYWGRVNADSAISTPGWPGLVITQYSFDGVVSAPEGAVGVQQDLKVTFQDVIADGTNIQATILPSLGYTIGSSQATLGSMSVQSTATADFHITRSGVYSEGYLPVRFLVADDARLGDTLTLLIPLTKIPGFVQDIPGIYGSSIKRVSNSVAWASFGFADQQSGQVFNAQFAQEAGEVWNDTSMLNDGTEPAYDVEAIDTVNAFFGTGSNPNASVIFTNDGGQDFSSYDVSSFTPFVNSIHFFDAQNGILIGDPKSNRWGIGVTTDGGQNWDPLPKPVSASGSIASWNNATSWVGNNGWFGTNSRQILRTTDRGQTWKSVTTGTNQNSLGVGFDDDATHGLACFQPVSSSGNYSMMGTADSGALWHSLTTLPAPGIEPGSVQFIPNSHWAILTSNMGVYRTTDFGATWSPIGIPVNFAADGANLSISRGPGEFVASINATGTGNGVATYTEAIPDSVEEGVAVMQAPQVSFEINPNPVQGTAMFSFTLPLSDRASIAIYDAVGRKISDVADRMFEQGPNYVAFDAHTLAPGAYYGVLETASGTHLTRAIIILR